MVNLRRNRSAADIALGYSADARGNGIAYATVATGNARQTIRLTFSAKPMPNVDGREQGYAAVTAVAEYIKKQGFGRVRIRLADEHVAGELGGGGKPPKALGMAYVRARCLLRGVGLVRIEAAASTDVRDLAARAVAEIGLHAAA